MIKTLADIPQNIRKYVARIFIICGIALAYSPYWIKAFKEKDVAQGVSDNLVSIGWWILAIGLIVYTFNLWIDVKSETDNTKESIDEESKP